jgi:hypothetical protein
MANIEELRKCVPLYEVVEHIVGDLGRPAVVLVQAEDKFEDWIEQKLKVRGLPAGRWQMPVVDGPTIEAWDRALNELIDAARHPKLKVRGFRAGREESEAVPPEEFAEVADNPFADFDFDAEYSGKRTLEFDEDHVAELIRSHFNGAREVLWTGLCAESGAEVLTLWPAQSPVIGKPYPPNLFKLLGEAKEKKGAPLTQREAEAIASDAGAKENQKEVRRVLERVQGKQKQGPRGPRAPWI